MSATVAVHVPSGGWREADVGPWTTPREPVILAVALMGGRPTLSPACRTFSAFPRRRGSKVPARLPQIRIVYIRQYPA